MYAQVKRVPEYTVLFNDESGRKQGCNTSKTVSESVLDFWRLNRHFGDFILINTEQGADGNGKYIRKCTDYNIRCFYQEWLLPPIKLQAKFAKHKAKFEKKLAEGKLTEARELNDRLLPLANACFIEVNPIPAKAAMNYLGYDCGTPRAPLTEIEDGNAEKLKTAMRNYGLELKV